MHACFPRRARRSAPRFLPLVLALLPHLAACGDGGEAEASTQAAASNEAPRSSDPRVARLRGAIAEGRLDLARTLLAQVGELAGAEAPLLRARAALLEGDELGAIREVEAARALRPDSARVNACAAEIYAILGRFDSAAQELERGVARSGETADLLRATGVLLILQPGGAPQGLKQLEAAYALDPELPFLKRPLSQALLLEGRRWLSEGRPGEALTAVKRARELDPTELDLAELEADCLGVLNDFEGALDVLSELTIAGRDVRGVRGELLQRAATFELVRGNRTQALAYYAEARELGLDDGALGFGATALAEEADLSIERGIAAYEAGDLSGARRAFEDALEVDTVNLAARNHLGVVLFREQRFAEAAGAWRAVLEGAAARGVELPEPVELNLARALKLAGEDAEARAVLTAFVAAEPAGPLREEAEEMLRRL